MEDFILKSRRFKVIYTVKKRIQNLLLGLKQRIKKVLLGHSSLARLVAFRNEAELMPGLNPLKSSIHWHYSPSDHFAKPQTNQVLRPINWGFS